MLASRHVVTGFLVCAALGCSTAAPPPGIVSMSVVDEVKAAMARADFVGGERLITADRAARGVTPLSIEAQAVLGRGALTANQPDFAERMAEGAFDLGVAQRPVARLDEETHVPIAMGAAIETLAQVQVARGARADAIAFLTKQLETYQRTSIAKKIQKNINLLTLEGRVAPAMDLTESLGDAAPSLDALKGKVVLMFFWAHWCMDCKAQGPILADLIAKYAGTDLTVIAPTQRYGYVAGGKNAPPDEERAYIIAIRHERYPWLETRPVPLATENHLRYGVSSTPTLVLVDRAGVIRLYHPGRMTAEDLDARIRALLAP